MASEFGPEGFKIGTEAHRQKTYNENMRAQNQRKCDPPSPPRVPIGAPFTSPPKPVWLESKGPKVRPTNGEKNSFPSAASSTTSPVLSPKALNAVLLIGFLIIVRLIGESIGLHGVLQYAIFTFLAWATIAIVVKFRKTLTYFAGAAIVVYILYSSIHH